RYLLRGMTGLLTDSLVAINTTDVPGMPFNGVHYDITIMREHLKAYANLKTASGARVEKIRFNDPRTWDIPGIKVVFTNRHNGHYHLEILEPGPVQEITPEQLQKTIDGLSETFKVLTPFHQNPAYQSSIPGVSKNMNDIMQFTSGLSDVFLDSMTQYLATGDKFEGLL